MCLSMRSIRSYQFKKGLSDGIVLLSIFLPVSDTLVKFESD